MLLPFLLTLLLPPLLLIGRLLVLLALGLFPLPLLVLLLALLTLSLLLVLLALGLFPLPLLVLLLALLTLSLMLLNLLPLLLVQLSRTELDAGLALTLNLYLRFPGLGYVHLRFGTLDLDPRLAGALELNPRFLPLNLDVFLPDPFSLLDLDLRLGLRNLHLWLRLLESDPRLRSQNANIGPLLLDGYLRLIHLHIDRGRRHHDLDHGLRYPDGDLRLLLPHGDLWLRLVNDNFRGRLLNEDFRARLPDVNHGSLLIDLDRWIRLPDCDLRRVLVHYDPGITSLHQPALALRLFLASLLLAGLLLPPLLLLPLLASLSLAHPLASLLKRLLQSLRFDYLLVGAVGNNRVHALHCCKAIFFNLIPSTLQKVSHTGFSSIIYVKLVKPVFNPLDKSLALLLSGLLLLSLRLILLLLAQSQCWHCQQGSTAHGAQYKPFISHHELLYQIAACGSETEQQ